MYMYVHLYIDDLQQGIFLKNIKHCTSKCQKCAPKPHFPHILCRMQGICKCTLGITSVRIPLLIKRDKLYLPGPAHYHQQSEPQGEQQGGGGEGANSKPQRLSHTFASNIKTVLLPNLVIVTVSQSTQRTFYDHIRNNLNSLQMIRFSITNDVGGCDLEI